MEDPQFTISLLLVLGITGILIASGLKKRPGIGVIGALIIAALSMWLRKEGLSAIGFSPPGNWATTILLGLGLGIAVQFISIIFIEPLSERITKDSHDHSIVEKVKGNWLAFVQWIIIVWVFVALLEEGLYRGFLMTEIAKMVGTSDVALAINVLVTSIIFGLSHGYQNRSGIVSTGVVGAILGSIFVLSDFNIWLAVFTHGFIDTVGISLIAIGKDKTLRDKLWKEQP